MQRIKQLKRYPLLIILLLLGVITLGSIAIGALVQNNLYIKAFDSYFYELFTRHFHSHFLDMVIAPFNFNFLPDWMGPLPSFQYFMILGGIVILFFRNRESLPWYMLTILIGALIVYVISIIDYRVVFRDRPFTVLPNDVSEIGRAAWLKISSFPSGHARETALFGTILSHYIPILKWPMILFVIFIAYSRIYVGAHFPTDTLAGVLIGFLAAKTALLITHELHQKVRQHIIAS